MKLSNFALISVLTLAAISSLSSPSFACDKGGVCGTTPKGNTPVTSTSPVIPSVTPSVPTMNNNNQSQSSVNNTVNSGQSQSNSNILGVSLQGNIPPGTFSFGGDGCSFTRNGNAISVTGGLTGSSGFGGSGYTGVVSWSSFSYDNTNDGAGICTERAKLLAAKAKMGLCSEASSLQRKGEFVTSEVIKLCGLPATVVVEAPPAPAPVVVIQQLPVVNTPPAYPTRAPQTSETPTGRH